MIKAWLLYKKTDGNQSQMLHISFHGPPQGSANEDHSQSWPLDLSLSELLAKQIYCLYRFSLLQALCYRFWLVIVVVVFR